MRIEVLVTSAMVDFSNASANMVVTNKNLPRMVVKAQTMPHDSSLSSIVVVILREVEVEAVDVVVRAIFGQSIKFVVRLVI